MTQLSPTSRIFFFSMVPPSLKRRSSLLTARGRPPGAIVVLRHGDRTKIYRAGAADLDTGLRPRPDDYMRIASVFEAFSGAVALSLVDRKLSLDGTIGERLPRLPASWGDVTLR